jgi:hypothetical protein
VFIFLLFKQKKSELKNKAPNEYDDLVERVRRNKENNLKLKKLYSDLERDYRNLSDTRIALEIKYDSVMQSKQQQQQQQQEQHQQKQF